MQDTRAMHDTSASPDRARVPRAALAGVAVSVAVTAALFAATHIGLDAAGSEGPGRRRDGAVDALLIDDDGFNAYWLFGVDAEGRWTQRSSGSMVWRGPGDDAMRAALRRGEVRTLPPPMQDLQIDGRRVMLLPSK